MTAARVKSVLDHLPTRIESSLVLLWAFQEGQLIGDTILVATLFAASQEEFFGLYRAE